MADTLQMMEQIRKRREIMDLMAAPDEKSVGEAVGKAFQDLYEGAIEKPARNALAGYKSGASGMYDLGANAMMLINRAGDYLTEKTGVGAMSKDTAFGAVENWLRNAARQMAPDAETLDDDVISKVYQGLGAAPAAIAEYATGARALGPVAGFAAVDALRAAEQGPEEMAIQGAKGALMGGAFKGVEGLKRAPRAGALATLGGAAAAGEGGGAEDVAAGAATLGILGGLGGPGRVGLRDIYRQPKGARQYPQEQARQDVLELVERVREQKPPTTAPTPPAPTPPAPARGPVPPVRLPGIPPREKVSTPKAEIVEETRAPAFRMTRDQVWALIEEKQMSDYQKLVKALGNEQKAKDFERLDRLRNSTNVERADKAEAEFDAKYGDLTREQERLIYGIRERDLQVSELKSVLMAIETVEDLPRAPISEVGRVLTLGLRKASREDFARLQKTGEGPGSVQEAHTYVTGALGEMKARGLSKDQIDRVVIDSMVKRGFRPDEAVEVLADYFGPRSAPPRPLAQIPAAPPRAEPTPAAPQGPVQPFRAPGIPSKESGGLRTRAEHVAQAFDSKGNVTEYGRKLQKLLRNMEIRGYRADSTYPFEGWTEVKAQLDAKLAKPKPRKRPVREERDILDFLANRGGVVDQTGELKAMDAHRWHREKPFRPRLVNEKGLRPDYAREAAEEAGYLPKGSSIDDLYKAMDDALRGRGGKTYQQEIRQQQQAEAAPIDRGEVEYRAQNLGIPPEVAARMSTEQLTATVRREDAIQQMHPQRPAGSLYSFPGPVVDTLQRAWRKVADRTIDALAEGRYSPFARWMGGYPFKDPTMGKLPGRGEYLGKRGEVQGQIFRFNRMANKLNDTLRRANEAERMAIYEYLTTKNAKPGDVPAKFRGAAVASKSLIKKTGRDLVRRGLLSKEAYEKHADAYLPRVYLKFLMERSPFTTGLKKSEEGYLKNRIEDLPQEYRDLFLGEIRDPGFLVTKAVSVPARDMALQDFLRDLTYNGRWVLPESTVEWTAPGMTRPRKVTPFWLKKESEILRDRARRMEDPGAQQRASAVADQMQATADRALGDLRGNVPKDYRQMPDSPRYGDLRGLVVRKEIYNDLVGPSALWIGEKGFYDKTWDKLGTANAIWKMMKVPLNPPTQVRNFVSNGVLLNLSGVPLARLPALYARALREIRKNGKHYRVAVKHGIPASTFSAEELVQIMPDVLRVRGQKGGVSSRLYKMAEPLARLTKAPGDLYQFSETWGKTVKIIDAMERQGMTERQAVAAAQEALFDYSLVPPLVKSLRSRPIGAPFITFYYKAFPAVTKAAIRDPGKMAAYYLLPYLLGDALLANLRDVEPEDVDKLREALPEWMREQGHTYVYPYKDESGRWTFTNFGYFLPWAMHERTLRNAYEIGTGEYGGSVGDLFSEFGILGGPVPQVGAVLMTGIDPFTQRRVFEETDPPKVQLYKALTWAWNLAGPSWLSDRGVVGHVQRSLQDEPNYYGEPPLSVPQALARGAGVNIYPVDPEVSRARNLRRMRFDIEEIRRAGRRTMRHRGLSEEKREDLQEQYREKMLEAIERLREYEKRSVVHPNLR